MCGTCNRKNHILDGARQKNPNNSVIVKTSIAQVSIKIEWNEFSAISNLIAVLSYSSTCCTCIPFGRRDLSSELIVCDTPSGIESRKWFDSFGTVAGERGTSSTS